ncbi:hypothetical protein CCZ37_15940 [Vibrio qinghaiensis]|uniref:Uncharacterized protein n=1 Tax=Vibrio qinghaiensis TaxID=2025808 RepID=A0A223N315_9VIBR|nr:hypothetical protein [Vibrio qinghaiensis]ASU24046.1 hypothetical protein CCZ37_15940 [Vibrio qinghaiensis]
MDVKLVEEYILEVLKEKFECEFEVVSGHRHFEFRSADYDFSFPVSIAGATSKQSIQKKVMSWLERDFESIKPQSYIIYNNSGVWQEGSVLAK